MHHSNEQTGCHFSGESGKKCRTKRACEVIKTISLLCEKVTSYVTSYACGGLSKIQSEYQEVMCEVCLANQLYLSWKMFCSHWKLCFSWFCFWCVPLGIVHGFQHFQLCFSGVYSSAMEKFILAEIWHTKNRPRNTCSKSNKTAQKQTFLENVFTLSTWKLFVSLLFKSLRAVLGLSACGLWRHKEELLWSLLDFP